VIARVGGVPPTAVKRPMEQDTLAEILCVEKELRRQLDDERARAEEWLAATRRELDAAHERELGALEAAGVAGEPAAARDASERAAQLLREAGDAARIAGGLRPGDLRPLVRRHLAAILPGGAP